MRKHLEEVYSPVVARWKHPATADFKRESVRSRVNRAFHPLVPSPRMMLCEQIRKQAHENWRSLAYGTPTLHSVMYEHVRGADARARDKFEVTHAALKTDAFEGECGYVISAQTHRSEATGSNRPHCNVDREEYMYGEQVAHDVDPIAAEVECEEDRIRREGDPLGASPNDRVHEAHDTQTEAPPTILLGEKAKCLDGTTAGYYMEIVEDEPSLRAKLNRGIMVFIEGGGWCYGRDKESTLADCVKRANGGVGYYGSAFESENNVRKPSSEVAGWLAPLTEPYYFIFVPYLWLALS